MFSCLLMFKETFVWTLSHHLNPAWQTWKKGNHEHFIRVTWHKAKLNRKITIADSK